MNAGIYIHIPFCIKKCCYCDFYSIEAKPHLIEQFLTAVQYEMMQYQKHPIFSQTEFQTFYFGGGTPSLLTTNQINKLVQVAQKSFRFSDNLEFTIEVNPETVDGLALKQLHDIGINRLSIGVQSFSDIELQRLGRAHNVKRAEQCIDWAYQAGFKNISLDLMFALPRQKVQDWLKNLDRALTFKPMHLSIYCLTIEPGTPLDQAIACGQFHKLDDEVEREMYLMTIDILSRHGYQQYEISNFARPGYECRHNQIYWNGAPYLGIGPSAHSFWHGHRQSNIRSVVQYCQLLAQGKIPVIDEEELSYNQRMLEYIFLSLRTAKGIDLTKFLELFQTDFREKFSNVFHRLSSFPGSKLFDIDNESIKLTPIGYVLFDKICEYFAYEV